MFIHIYITVHSSIYDTMGSQLCNNSVVKLVLTEAGIKLPFPVGKWKGLGKECASMLHCVLYTVKLTDKV